MMGSSYEDGRQALMRQVADACLKVSYLTLRIAIMWDTQGAC